MHAISVSPIAAPDHAYEAIKDEARLIQDSLLPTGPLCAANFEIAFRYAPLGEVGGDFADFYYLPNGLVGLYIGDVVGKGVTAALYAALVMGMIRAIHKTGTDPATVLSLLNKRLSVRPVPGRFSSTLYAVFNPATGELDFSNAGIPLPMLASHDDCRLVGSGGFPSAMFPVASYDTHRLRLLPGDAILFATDGLHEIQNDREEDLSSGKLEEIWRACRAKSADQSLDFLFEEIQVFAQNGRHHDDITAIALKVPANAVQVPPGDLENIHVENLESLDSPSLARP